MSHIDGATVQHPRAGELTTPLTATLVEIIVIDDEDEAGQDQPDNELEVEAVQARQARATEAVQRQGEITSHSAEDDAAQPQGVVGPLTHQDGVTSVRESTSATSRLAHPTTWPPDVINLRDNFNTDEIQYVNTLGICDCTAPCPHPTCMKPALGIYCSKNCCPYRGYCGNSPRQSPHLRLMRNMGSQDYFVQATRAIEAGVIIGEYLGRLTGDLRRGRRNRGYRLAMRHAPDASTPGRVCIDAQVVGSLMRFLNHSCDANTRFLEMCNLRRHTIAVVTRKSIRRGEEVTVDYGDELWFPCQCGTAQCRHRDQQIDA